MGCLLTESFVSLNGDVSCQQDDCNYRLFSFANGLKVTKDPSSSDCSELQVGRAIEIIDTGEFGFDEDRWGHKFSQE